MEAAKKLEDLRQRQAQREAERKAKVAADRSQQRPEQTESLDLFLDTFGGQQLAIEADIAELGSIEPGKLEAGAVKARLDEVARAVLRLQQTASLASTLFLPDSVVQRTQQQLARLTGELEAERGRLLPKRKFGFKGARSAVAKVERVEKVVEVAAEQVDKKPTAALADEPDLCLLDWTVSTRSDAEIVLSAAATDARDIRLSGLRRCLVRILGRPGSVQLSDCQDCLVRCVAPVARSMFCDRVLRSRLVFACQQCRLHRSSEVEVHMHCGSRPVIEDCNRMRVAPYDADGAVQPNGNWADVADFDWLANAEASPNWSVMPEAERPEGDWPQVEAEFRKRFGLKEEAVAEAEAEATPAEGME